MAPPAKRKAGEDHDEAPPTSKSKKMSKEEKSAARERARVAVMGGGTEAAAGGETPVKKGRGRPKGAKNKTPAERAEAKQAVEAKRAAKKAKQEAAKSPASAKPAAPKKEAPTKVPIREQDKKPAAAVNNENENEMPLPPTTLQRTQSTPLELELQHQVVENLKAAEGGKEPKFTKAPPDHLLKFAPKELEEGYDHDESNAKDIEEPEEDDTKERDSKQDALDQEWKKFVAVCAGASLLVLYMIFMYSSEGSYIRLFFHAVMARIPFAPSYRTSNGFPIPYMPCYLTNVDNPVQPHYREECQSVPKVRCPPLGLCWGGELQECKEPYVKKSRNGKSCIMTPEVKKVYDQVVSKLQIWTFDHQCREALDAKEFSYDYVNEDEVASSSAAESPEPYMMVSMKDGDPPTKQPMFELDYFFDAHPFLLSDHLLQQADQPTETLYKLLEEVNTLTKEVKLQILTRYETTTVTRVNEEGHEYEAEEKEATKLHLVAIFPSKELFKILPLKMSCRVHRVAEVGWKIYARGMQSAWLLMLWACSTMLALWWLVLHKYLEKANRQHEFLVGVEGVRVFALKVLEDTQPKQWGVKDLKQHVLENCSYAKDNAEEFEERIWRRVVFEIRGHPRVMTKLEISGGTLLDLWTWTDETASAQT